MNYPEVIIFGLYFLYSYYKLQVKFWVKFDPYILKYILGLPEGSKSRKTAIKLREILKLILDHQKDLLVLMFRGSRKSIVIQNMVIDANYKGILMTFYML